MKLKKIQFSEHEDQHARLLTRLRYDCLSQAVFFRSIVSLYVDSDVDMLKVLKKIKDSTKSMSKKRINRSYLESKSGKELLSDLIFTEKQKSALYDLIEENLEEN